jgi:hypothetical protein
LRGERCGDLVLVDAANSLFEEGLAGAAVRGGAPVNPAVLGGENEEGGVGEFGRGGEVEDGGETECEEVVVPFLCVALDWYQGD